MKKTRGQKSRVRVPLKRSKFAVGHFHITTQLQSVRSDDSVIYSTTSPLHHFYYIHFASDSNYDPNPAASGRFIDSTTLPLHGDPIHNVCDGYSSHHESLLMGNQFKVYGDASQTSHLYTFKLRISCLDVVSVNSEVTSVLAVSCPFLRHLELGGCPAVGDQAVSHLRYNHRYLMTID
jgi:hypothetical protein